VQRKGRLLFKLVAIGMTSRSRYEFCFRGLRLMLRRTAMTICATGRCVGQARSSGGDWLALNAEAL
jgi:hypothetical protein